MADAAVQAASKAPEAPVSDLDCPVPDLSIGDRVEVLWKIERDPEDGVLRSEERWWGATIHGRSGNTEKYVLLYDEYLEFPPAHVNVSLVGPKCLRDEDSNGDMMWWRREGDTTVTGDDTFPEVDDDCGEVAGNAIELADKDVYSMRDVVRAQEEVDAEQGESAGEAMMAALGSLPLTHQTEMAIKYRQFADGLKSELAALMRQRGPGCVVTESDIQTLFAKIRDCDAGAQKL
jgi:hypothetical protein